jgi:hypothetical protein
MGGGFNKFLIKLLNGAGIGLTPAESDALYSAAVKHEWDEMTAYLERNGKRIEHPADKFDRMTANGYKLNLLTGQYYKD